MNIEYMYKNLFLVVQHYELPFQLADQVISPKDDLARQLKEAKRKSKQKVDDLERQELEETMPESEVAEDGTLPMSEVAEDGTLPMPDDETVEPAEKEEPTEESRISRLKRKDKTEESKKQNILTPDLLFTEPCTQTQYYLNTYTIKLVLFCWTN